MSGHKRSFEYLDHTADFILLARGVSPGELFSSAAEGMLELMVGLSSVEERETLSLSVKASDWESLLVDWLDELLFQFEAYGWIARRIVFEAIEPTGLRATTWGERVDPGRHDLRREVKAVTYHDLAVRRTDGWEARVTLDV